MARVKDMGINLCQAGIRAQCIEEANEIKNNPKIHTYYAHQIRENNNWVKEIISDMTENVAEMGSHEALLANKGPYYELYQIQLLADTQKQE